MGQTGELLAVIDLREFNVALAQATAQEQSARARQDDAKANLTRQSALIDAAQAERQAAQAELAFARQEQNRYQRMASSGAGSQQARAGDNAGAHAFRQCGSGGGDAQSGAKHGAGATSCWRTAMPS